MIKQNAATRENAIKIRERVKRKKPNFVRQESWRYKRLKENWRRPKGIDNKMRMKIKGWPPTVNVGYRGPKAARGLHPSGYQEVLVHNLVELSKVNPKTQVVRVAHTVGKRKRVKIIAEAKKKKITIVNLKEIKEKAEEKKEELEEETEKLEEKEEKKAEKEKPKAKRKKTRKSEEGAKEE
jgi:large subunit ribosomal protein L32e